MLAGYTPQQDDQVIYTDCDLFAVWRKDEVLLYFKSNFKLVKGRVHDTYTIGTTRKAMDIANELVIEYYQEYAKLLRNAQTSYCETEDVFG